MRKVRIAFVVLVVAALIVPPWATRQVYLVGTGHLGGRFVGFRLIGTQPSNGVIAWGTLTLELAAVAAVTFGVSWAARSREPPPSPR